MREIKFRAWDTTYNDMSEVLMLDIGDETVVFKDEHGDRQRRDLVHMELMQFTGLKDKNGVEIYEGDVVDIGKTGYWRGSEVCRTETGTLATAKRDGVCSDWRPDEWAESEVIGNIYDNPELLEVAS